MISGVAIFIDPSQDVVLQDIRMHNSSSDMLLEGSDQNRNSSTGTWLFSIYKIPIFVPNFLLASSLLVLMGLTICGNVLVILVVIRERVLRTVTNYYIVSLALADLLMGSIVMPFAVTNELLNGHWLFSTTWCHLWQAFDVLSSTASILNLCVIAVDRYWATRNPLTYSQRMVSARYCVGMMTAVWVLSSAISFPPAIVWWPATSKMAHQCPANLSEASASCEPNHECVFTDDPVYLVTSSLISFYIPLCLMVVAYVNIFRTARRVMNTLKSGHKVIYSKSSPANPVVMRIHRGGQQNQQSSPGLLNSGCSSPYRLESSPGSTSASLVGMEEQTLMVSTSPSRPFLRHKSTSSERGSLRHRSFAMGRRLTKFSREQKAAKTLGVVMGIFIICWMPFFLCNTAKAIHKDILGDEARSQLIFAVVTYLGYVNSAINPLIYAHSLRDFRLAFMRILCTQAYLARQQQSGCQHHWTRRSHNNSSIISRHSQQGSWHLPRHRPSQSLHPPSSPVSMAPLLTPCPSTPVSGATYSPFIIGQTGNVMELSAPAPTGIHMSPTDSPSLPRYTSTLRTQQQMLASGRLIKRGCVDAVGDHGIMGLSQLKLSTPSIHCS